MKKAYVLLVTIFVSLTLFACGPGEDPNTITFWHTYGDNEEAVLKDVVIPMWNELNPDIPIKPVRQDSGQFNEMLTLSFGTGAGPDVARIDIVQTAGFAELGGLVKLDDMSGFNTFKNTFLDGPLSTNYYQDGYYGVPLDTNAKAAVVNMTLLESELELTELPATWEELEPLLDAREGYSISVSGVGDWDSYPYFWLFGGELTNSTFTQASGYINSAESVAAINKIKDLRTKGILTIRDIDGTADAWAGINDQYIMFFEGPWAPFNDNIKPALIPTYQGKSATVVGGENIVILETAKNKENAYEFVKFMTSEDVQLAMLTSGQIPVLKSLVNHEDVLSDPKWSVYMEQLESAHARIPSPNHSDISEVWSDAMLAIFLEGADVKTTLDAAAAELDTLLSQE
ncbi:extracellular solute-binding protein [Acholeplasma equirhinis]|uniref:extracellular solute-binding protein n=1 Tax=Acholeplasma equirhinis TaxID=555393 RepID=UPI00197AD73D|nr:extracellular solute-binding protein [Acholeplasma equirhinis]MBN3490105.1 extracellular solute-binding protein [Acholeplasma equirhinis]